MGCEERAFSNPWPTCVELGRWWWGAPGEELGHLCPDQELSVSTNACLVLFCIYNAGWWGLKKYSMKGGERGMEGHASTEITSFYKRHVPKPFCVFISKKSSTFLCAQYSSFIGRFL